jgi:hypothetical protein
VNEARGTVRGCERTGGAGEGKTTVLSLLDGRKERKREGSEDARGEVRISCVDSTTALPLLIAFPYSPYLCLETRDQGETGCRKMGMMGMWNRKVEAETSGKE